MTKARTSAKLVPLLAVLACAVAASPALAGWTSSKSVTSLREPEVVAGSVPGVVSVLGIDANGSALVSVHTPGASWSDARPLVTTDGAAEDGVTGPGGAFAVRRDSGTVAISQVSAGGTLRPVATLANPDVNPVAVAAAPDGTLVMLGSTDSDDLRAYGVAAGSQVVARVGGPGALLADGDVGDASIVATTGSAFQALWILAPDGAAPSVRTRPLDASGFGSPERTLSAGVDDGDSVSSPSLAVSGSTTIGGWVQAVGQTGGSFARVRSISAFDPSQGPALIAGNAAVSEIAMAGAGDGSVLVFAAGDGSPDGSAVAAVGPGGVASCVTPTGALRAAPVARGGAYALVTQALANVLAAADVAAGSCAAGPPDAGPDAGEAGELAAAADGEGTLATAATADEATTLVARDVTAPDAAEIAVTRTADGFDASVSAADAWGPISVAWTVDDRAAGSGSSVGVTGLAPGRHTLVARIADGAGNARTRTATLDVPSDAQPAAPPPAAVPGATPAEPPRVLSARILLRAGVWLARVRISGGERVRLTLLRERYLERHRSRCGRHERNRPATGRQGQFVASVTGPRTVRIALPADMQRALRRRGRYQLSFVALGAEDQSSPAKRRRVTVCTSTAGRSE